jgi:hypothetical protein
MVKQITKIVALSLLLMLLTLSLAKPTRASFVTTVNETTPITLTVFNPCSGELLVLKGTLHTVRTVIFADSGQISIYYHFQREVSGISAGGVYYRGSGVNQGHTSFSAGDAPYEATYVTTLRIIGQGPGDNFLLHVNGHLTINADGTLTSSHDFFSSECR